MKRLLMIDDDEKLVGLMREYLESHGFELAAAHDGNEAVEAALSTQPDLLVLDLMLPGIDGLEVCRRVRQSSRVPILMLTAKGDETDRIVGLEMGADDYLAKPFNARELLARIRAILRRSDGEEEPGDASVLQTGSLRVDIGSRRARRCGFDARTMRDNSWPTVRLPYGYSAICSRTPCATPARARSR